MITPAASCANHQKAEPEPHTRIPSEHIQGLSFKPQPSQGGEVIYYRIKTPELLAQDTAWHPHQERACLEHDQGPDVATVSTAEALALPLSLSNHGAIASLT